ncbi:hypothetical protein EDD71_10157 [Fonticella tunisiensis]|uniref:DUF4352 domain-containing protein n=2 Tax=Fonticella tunisiensis TaxID=1096341 RepID=A0A4R7KVH6_9CLOT|nr:hypothetical protein EDD71_10157 [Fonticella tunisiensis]
MIKQKSFIVLPLVALIIGLAGGYFIYTKMTAASKMKDKDGAVISENISESSQTGSNVDNSSNKIKSQEDDKLRDKLLKIDSRGSVQVGATILNPIEKDDKYIVIEMQFDTHSVDLDVYDFQRIATFKTSDGVEMNQEIIWEKADGGGHHYLGKYKIPKVVDGKPVITEKTESIELDIKGLDNVENRTFKWEKDVIKLLKN